MDEEVKTFSVLDNLYEGIEPFIYRGRNRVIAQTMFAVEEFIDRGSEAHSRIREALMNATESQMYETQVKYSQLLSALASKRDP